MPAMSAIVWIDQSETVIYFKSIEWPLAESKSMRERKHHVCFHHQTIGDIVCTTNTERQQQQQQPANQPTSSNKQ